MAAHPIANHRAAHLAPDHETGAGTDEPTISRLDIARMVSTRVVAVGVRKREMNDEPRPSRPATQPHRGGEVGALAQPGRGRKHGNSRFRATSGRKALTALPTASGEDGATGASAHAQPKAVGLCASAIVRLKRALAHSRAPREGPVRPGVRKAVRAAGQKELLRYGATGDTVKPGPTPFTQGFDPVHATLVPWETRSGSHGSNCGERLEAHGGTLLASHGPDLIDANTRSSDMMRSWRIASMPWR